MSAAKYYEQQDDAFNAIKDAFPDASDEEVNAFMDICEDDGIDPTPENFKDFGAF